MSEAPARTPDCEIEFEGEAVAAVTGEPIAVALFAHGTKVFSRSAKYHRPRSFFCLAGHCGACLMRVDGEPNVRACQSPARQGRRVERQNAFPSGSLDVLAAADFFFPRGMDHHTLLTAPRAVNALMQKVVRQIGGLGRLPDGESLVREASRRRHVDVVIVGAGPAGLAAANACAGDGRTILLVDEGVRPGGSLLSHPAFGPAVADVLVARARDRGVELLSRAGAFGWFPEDDGGTLAVNSDGRLLRITARRYVYATGGNDVSLRFEDNDRPGIFAARAVGALLVQHHVVAGRRPIVVGDGAYAGALAEALGARGAAVTRVDGRRERVVAARGKGWVRGLEIETQGRRRRVDGDVVAIAARPAPASELPRQHGVAVQLAAAAGGFACRVDERGRSRVPEVFAAGDVCGFGGVAFALAHGERVGAAVAEEL